MSERVAQQALAQGLAAGAMSSRQGLVPVSERVEQPVLEQALAVERLALAQGLAAEQPVLERASRSAPAS